MNPERDAELCRWRDAMLWRIAMDISAAQRLAPGDWVGVEAAADVALEVEPPRLEERGGMALDGLARDPEHPSHGHVSWDDYRALLKAEGRG